MILGTGDSCSYLVPGSSVDTAWTDPVFDDGNWAEGAGGVGYGDGDDETEIPPALSVLCRYRFQVSDPGLLEDLVLYMDFDDGFAAWINGTEVARSNLGQPGGAIAWDQPADENHEAQLYQAGQPESYVLGQEGIGLLDSGTNVLCVRVHNTGAGSSDMSSNVFLMATTEDTAAGWNEPPAWFLPPFPFEGGELPVMVINTGGRDIPNEPRITANMGLIYRGPGHLHRPGDPFNVYDGQISIEVRGESSRRYPKESYSIETQTDSGTNNNVSLLGLPEENDYVLYGPFGDKSQVRNVISYRLYRDMGHYAPRTRFFELVLNGDYRGLYVLTEKIKRDNDRVDIATLTPADTGGIELTGGYILRADKTTGEDPDSYWESDVEPPVGSHWQNIFQYFDPKYEELTAGQRTYIREWLKGFEEALAAPVFRDPVVGYRAYLDIPSFIDLMILNELTKDVDAYGYSHYFYKQRDDRGGKLVQGPPWDYNLTFGNMDFAGDVKDPEGWVYTKGKAVFWWERVMGDSWFREQLYCRWTQVRDSLITEERILRMIGALEEETGEAVTRNYQRWPVLGLYVWPNYFVADTYDEEIRFLKAWIRIRINWLDEQWGNRCLHVGGQAEQLRPQDGILVYPNPSDFSRLHVALSETAPGQVDLRIWNAAGQLVFSSCERAEGPVLILPDLSRLEKGFYIMEVRGENRVGKARLIRH